MNSLHKSLIISALAFFLPPKDALRAQSVNCANNSDEVVLTGEVFFNYGSTTAAFNTLQRGSHTVGQPCVGESQNQSFTGGLGFWTRFLLPPSAPAVAATEGDLPDRIQVEWTPDPLSPAADKGFNIYRNGALLASVDADTRAFVDFNVLAGQFYTYAIAGKNQFGLGYLGTALGFLNPNGVVTGRITTFSGNPVPEATVTMSPTLGAAVEFNGDDKIFAEPNAAFPQTTWSVSCWVKIGAGNDGAGILDLGSSSNKNFWIHTIPTSVGTGKGVKIGVGEGSTAKNLQHVFPALTADDWHHVAMTYNGGSVILYVDGEFVGTVASGFDPELATLFFGQRSDATGFFTGKLDDVRIFDRQLAQTEIQMTKNRTVNSDADGLVAYWKFDEGTGSKGFDLAPNKIKSYLCGAAWTTDKPAVQNAGMTDLIGFYKIEGINYGAGNTFTATAEKTFHFNQSLEFNASNGQYADLTNFDLPDTATVSFTFKPFDLSGTQSILSKQGAGGATQIQAVLDAGVLKITLGSTEKTYGSISAGFHHVAMTTLQTGSSVAASVFIDGAQVGTEETFLGVDADFSTGTAWTLGAKRPASGGSAAFENHFTGLIDEAAFFEKNLSLPEIQLANSLGTNAGHPQLKNYFNLNEGIGDSIMDMGSALTGKSGLHGATWSASAKITETLPHEFSPSSKLVTLNPSNTSTDAVNFTDMSTVPVSGYVRFDGTDCFADSVEILGNGGSFAPPIYTNADGKFIVDLEPGASMKLSPRFKNHSFFPMFWDVGNVTSPIAGILFRDMTKRTVEGQIAGGHCRKGIIPLDANGNVNGLVKVKVESLDGCFSQTKQILVANGKFNFANLPPKRLTIALIEHSNPVIYNYFQLQGGSQIDLREANDTTDFIYYAPPVVEMSALDTNQCGAPMLEMNRKYSVKIRVFQDYEGGRCYLDTAALAINNLIADADQLDTLMTQGILTYKFKAALPQLTPPHLKTLQVTATANEQFSSDVQQAVVLGIRPRTTAFATTSPQIPLVVLRDPPGDASYAYLEKDEQVCKEWSFDFVSEQGNGLVEKISVGPNWEIQTGFGVLIGTDGDVVAEEEGDFVWTKTASTTESNSVCVSTTTLLTTAGDDLLVGPDADIFMGGALNLIFGITDKLIFDAANCAFKLDTGMMVVPQGFATTYLYTRYHILNEVIPNLLAINDTKSANEWKEIIKQDSLKQKNDLTFEKNFSFSSGVTYEVTTSTETSKSSSMSLGKLVDEDVVIQAGFFANDVGASAGYHYTFHSEDVKTNGTADVKTVTAGYVLSDDDPGDNFTVDVFKDKHYGTHGFKTRSGQSSCPHEKGTQPREEVAISVDKVAAVNVPENGEAVFKFTLGNISQSNDAREYLFSLISESNPNGAVVKINGGSPLDRPFGIEAFKGQEVTVTIARGATEHVYEDLEFAIFSDCEDGRGVALGLASIDPKFYKSVLLDVQFVEPCSPVDIGFPLQDWVMNPGGGTILNITAIDYDEADPDLELIRAQYRRSQGDGAWINIADVAKADLGDIFEIIPWDTDGLQDGLYEVRVVSQCTGGQNAGISHVMKGKIERTPPEIFGTPEPADGVYSSDDEISITFNEPIRCDLLIQADFFNNNNVGLYDTETDNLIDAVITCSSDKITLVPNVPNKYLENKLLRVEIDDIDDLADNTFDHADWEFTVDRNGLNWVDNVEVYVAKYQEQIRSVERRIENRGGFITSFEIENVPNWVRIYPQKGVLAVGQVQVITFEFDSTLVFGAYADTIVLHGVDGDEPLGVKSRIVCHDPNWQVNAADWDYSHNFTLQLDIEGTVSTDIEDIVGAFVNGELRGVSKLKPVKLPGPITKYEAFLTVYSNEFSGETIDFQIWDASACLKYGSVLESFAFEADGLQGSPQTPTVLHTNNQVLREIELHPGWNWISFNLAFANNSLGSVLASVNDPVGDLIKSQTQFAQNDATFGWLGSLTSILNPPMYQYRTADADTIHQLGTLIDPTTVNIPISVGWNWIGFVPQFPLTVNEALASLVPLNGDLIKSQTQFAQFLAGFGWIGNLEYMSPPNGYLLKMASAGTLTYPDAPVGKPNLTPGPSPKERGVSTPLLWRGAGGEAWQVDPTKFEHSQTLIAMLENGGANVTGKDFELGAFVGNECRGAAKAIWIEPLQAHLFFQTIYANTTGEQLKFKFFDGKDISELSETMFFSADAAVGTIQNPFKFSTTILSSDEIENFEPFLDVLPNPVSDYATIRFRSEKQQNVFFKISDATGRLMQAFDYQSNKGMNAMLWEKAGELPAGVYLLEMTEGERKMTEKIVVR